MQFDVLCFFERSVCLDPWGLKDRPCGPQGLHNFTRGGTVGGDCRIRQGLGPGTGAGLVPGTGRVAERLAECGGKPHRDLLPQKTVLRASVY